MRSWELIDQAIAGTLTGGLSGFTVSYNSDGTVVAIAAPFGPYPGNRNGSVRVYKLITTWQQIGLTLVGPSTTNFGRGLSLNSDGTIMAVGAPLDGGNSDGSVFVYQLNNLAGIYNSLSTGTNSTVFSVACDTNGDLYAGGNFTEAGTNSSFYYNRIAKWNGSSWSPLGSGSSSSGVNDTVYSLAFDGNRNLYAGGEFNFAGGNSANKIAKWNSSTSSWSPLGSGLSAVVYSLAFDGNGNLYAGGDFTGAGGISANRIAMWNDASWSAVGSGLNNSVRCLAFDGSGNLYAGGLFTTAGGNSANYIAKWDGSSWSPLGSGLNNLVRCLAFDGNGNLYAGGDFTTAGGNSANRIAKWNGSSWSALDSGLDGPSVRTLTFDASGTLFAGGSFLVAGGISASRIARWNGTSWSNLGSGIDNSVFASTYNTTGNNLFFGGGFATAGGRSARNITSVYIAPNWEQLGATITGFYISQAGRAVCINTSGDNISVAIGYIYSDNLENQGLARVFRWNRTTSVWERLGGNIVGTLAHQALGSSVSFNSTGTRLAAGGASGYFAGSTSPIVAIFDWNSTAWVRVGQIINGPYNTSPFGQSSTNTSLSSDGTTVAIGSQLYTIPSGNKQYAGRVQVFTYNGSTWVQRGQNIDGVNAGDKLGISVSLNSDGTILAVGVPSGELGSPGSRIGYVSVYQWYSPGSVWQKIGKQNINGTLVGDNFGFCVSLTSDGSRLAIGAPYFNTANISALGQTSAFRAIGTKDATIIDVSGSITKVYADPSFNLNASTNNDETPIVYSVTSSTPANIVTVDVSGNVTILGAGTATISLSQQQTTNYLAGSATTTLTILKAPTVIIVDTSLNTTYVNPSSTLNLDASTNNTQTPITYSVTASNPAGIIQQPIPSTGIITILGAGTATIELTQDESSNYLAGSTTTTVNVAKATPTITVKTSFAKDYGTDVSFNLDASSNNPETSILYSVDPSGESVVSVDASGLVTIVAPGTAVITLTQLETTNYLAPTPRTSTVNIYTRRTWEQIGLPIDGANANVASGTYVSINSDGTIVAIGASGGPARVFKWNPYNPTSMWEQLGQSILGQSTSTAGLSVSLNSAGTILAVGVENSIQAFVYRWNDASSNWVQLGQTLTRIGAVRFGCYVTLNSDGTLLAVGDFWGASLAGSTTVYQWNSGSSLWVQLGSPIIGPPSAQSGSSLSFNSAGTRIATGFRVGNGVNIYDWNSSSWVQVGQTITGQSGSRYGHSVSLDSTGTILAIGAPLYSSTQYAIGRAQVYQLSGSTWVQRGQNIDGIAVADCVGHSVSLDSTGTILCVGAPGGMEDGLNNKLGYVSVYQWYSPTSVWQKISQQNVNGPAINSYFGASVSLNSTGKIFATGTPRLSSGRGQTIMFQDVGPRQTTVINVASAITKTFGNAAFILDASSNNNETPIVYSVTSSTPANIVTVDVSGNVTILGAGTATISLSQQQTTNYLAGSATTTLTILKAPTTITVDPSFNRTYAPDLSFNLDASTNNTQTPINYSVTASDPAGIIQQPIPSTGIITILGAGTATIELTQDASSNYLDGSANTIINVAKASNTINVQAAITKTFGDASFNLGASSNNTQTSILYSVDPSGANVVSVDASGNVTIINAGTAIITSSQPASANYLAADSKTTTITVNKATPVITVDSSFNRTYAPDLSFNLNASSTSPAPITYDVSFSDPSGIIHQPIPSSGVVTILGAGTAIIRVSQAESANYLAGSTTTTVNIAKAPNTIIVDASFTRTYGDASFNLGATSTNKQTSILYNVTASNPLDPLTVSVDASGNVTIQNGGTATITLTQPESANYLAAASKQTLITINKATPVITVDPSFTRVYGTDASFNLNATSTNTDNQTPIIYTSNNTAVARVSNTGVVTIVGAGTAIIDLAQDSNRNYVSASTTTQITILKAPSVITVDPSFSTTYAPDLSLDLDARSNNTQTSINYTVTASDPSGIIQQPIPSTGIITIVGAGIATITLTQDGSSNYFPANPVTTIIDIQRATTVITVPSSITKTYGTDVSFNLGANSNSPSPISYSVDPSGANVVSVDQSGNVTIKNAGTAIITTSQNESPNFTAGSATTTITVNKATPVIDVSGSITTTYVDPSSTLSLTATSTSPAPITYDVSFSTPENIVSVDSSSGLVTIVGAGTAIITSSQVETANYKAGSATTTLTINKITTVINVDASFNVNYGDASFNLDASSNSPAPIIYESSSPSVADVSSNGVVTINGQGTTTITLSQVFTNNYTIGSATTLITVKQGITVIKVDSSFNTVYGTDISFNLNATTNNNDTPITYSSSNRTVATVTTPDQPNPGTVTIVGAGTATITLNQLGYANTNYSAGSATTTINVAKAANTITIDPSFSTTYVDAMSTLNLSATSSNTQTSIIYNVTASTPSGIIYSVSSTGLVTIIGAGTATIQLTQPASQNYEAATPVTTTINIAKASNTITVDPSFSITYAVNPTPNLSLGDFSTSDNKETSIIYTVTASDPSGIIQIVSDGEPGDIAILGAGTATLTLSQPESDNYLAATPETTAITVDRASNTITAPSSIDPSPTFGDPTFNLGATSNNTQTSIIYSVDPSAGVVSVDASGNVTIQNAGTATITSSQPQSANYNAANPVTTDITVNKATPVITVPDSSSISNKTYGDPSFNLNASSNSPATISYSVSSSSVDPSAVTVDQTGQVTILTAGTATIILSQDASGNYNSGSETITIIINQLSNTITVDSSFNKTYGDASFNLGASSNNSDSSIIYEVDPSGAGVVNVDTSGNVTILGVGATTITLTQPETTNYKAATTAITAIYVEPASSLIIVDSSFNTVYGAASFNLGATSNNPAPISYESTSPSVASVDPSGNVTIKSQGQTTITLRQSGNINYNAGLSQTTINVNQATTVINVDSSFNRVFGAASFNLDASSNNNERVITYSVSSNNQNVVNVTTPDQANPGTVTIVGAGTATITLNQSGDLNTNYSQGSAQTKIIVDPSSSIINVPLTISKTYGTDVSFNLNATSNNPAPISYKVDPSGVGVVYIDESSGVVTILTAGIATITSSQDESANYTSASATTTVNVAKASNTINVDSSFNRVFGAASFNLDASSNNNDTSILYSVDPSAGVVSVDTSGNVSILGGDSATITLTQPASQNYDAATSVTTDITIDPSSSIIRVDSSFNTVFGTDVSFNLGASSNNNQTPITYSVDPSAGVVTVDLSGNVTIDGAGTATITLSQEGNSNYTAAAQVTTEITVARAASIITVLGSPFEVIYGGPSFNLGATTNNTETPITYFVSSSTVDPSAVSVDQSGNVTIEAIGNATVTLSQVQTDNYKAASVTTTVIVSPIPTVITAKTNLSKNIGDPDFNLDASSNSPATIIYSSSTPNILQVDQSGNVTVVGSGKGIILLQQLLISIYSSGSFSSTINVTPIQTVINVDSSFNKVVGNTFSLDASTNNPDPETPIEYIRGSLSVEVDKSGFVTINSIPTGGQANITLNQSGNDQYTTGSTNTIIYVSPIPTVINVDSSFNKTYGTDVSFNLDASSNSPATITYESSDTNIVTVDESGEVTIVAVGTATITLTQTASGNYGPASANTIIYVSKASSNIKVDSSFNPVYGTDASFNLDASSNNTQTPITYESNDTNVVTVGLNTGQVTIQGAGEATITLTQDGSSNYLDGSANTIIYVSKASTNITVDSSFNVVYGPDVSFNLGATSNNSQTAITYGSSNIAIATVNESGEVTVKGAGEAIITLSQDGSSNYLDGSANTIIYVRPITTEIIVDSSFNKTYGTDVSFNLDASSNSPAPISYTVDEAGQNVVTVGPTTGEVTIVAAGEATITLTQDPSGNYSSDTASTTIYVTENG